MEHLFLKKKALSKWMCVSLLGCVCVEELHVYG